MWTHQENSANVHKNFILKNYIAPAKTFVQTGEWLTLVLENDFCMFTPLDCNSQLCTSACSYSQPCDIFDSWFLSYSVIVSWTGSFLALQSEMFHFNNQIFILERHNWSTCADVLDLTPHSWLQSPVQWHTVNKNNMKKNAQNTNHDWRHWRFGRALTCVAYVLKNSWANSHAPPRTTLGASVTNITLHCLRRLQACTHVYQCCYCVVRCVCLDCFSMKLCMIAKNCCTSIYEHRKVFLTSSQLTLQDLSNPCMYQLSIRQHRFRLHPVFGKAVSNLHYYLLRCLPRLSDINLFFRHFQTWTLISTCVCCSARKHRQCCISIHTCQIRHKLSPCYDHAQPIVKASWKCKDWQPAMDHSVLNRSKALFAVTSNLPDCLKLGRVISLGHGIVSNILQAAFDVVSQEWYNSCSNLCQRSCHKECHKSCHSLC